MPLNVESLIAATDVYPYWKEKQTFDFVNPFKRKAEEVHALVKTPEMNEQGKRSRIENPASIQPTPENPKREIERRQMKARAQSAALSENDSAQQKKSQATSLAQRFLRLERIVIEQKTLIEALKEENTQRKAENARLSFRLTQLEERFESQTTHPGLKRTITNRNLDEKVDSIIKNLYD